MLDRRAFVATGLASLLVAADDRKAHAGTPNFKKIREVCDACQAACEKAALHRAALKSEEQAKYAFVQYACEDCSSICAALSDVIARSETRPYGNTPVSICMSSAEVCDATAKACRQVPDDEVLEACAVACVELRGRLHGWVFGC